MVEADPLAAIVVVRVGATIPIEGSITRLHKGSG